MKQSRNLFLIGATGAGKSSLGRCLAHHYGLTFVDLDHAIEQRTGVPIPRIFDIEGEAGFRQRESSELASHCQQSGIVLSTGAGAIMRDVNRQRLTEHGFVLWLDISIEEQLKRLARDRKRPLLQNIDNRRQKFTTMASQRTPLYRTLADARLPVGSEPIKDTLGRAVHLLSNYWDTLAND